MYFRGGLKLIVTGEGAADGMNGWFEQTVQPEENCLPGTEGQAWNEKPRQKQRSDLGKPKGRNAGEHEGATRGKRLVSLSRIGFRHH
ncbi:hypothetical protein AN666_26460 [Enterobacter hormaechei]|nr:hypothetical protein AN666_26460 [Enterobacter hormaechei]